MSRLILLSGLLLVMAGKAPAQTSFDYTIDLQPVNVPGLPGLHSYACAQHNGKWLIIGGRKDGVHARQPFNAFPQAQNNTGILVIDIGTQQYWSAPVTTLSAGLAEQLQSTNMNFYQDNDTLYIIGGYAFSASANDHITFPYLTSVDVPSLIAHVISGAPISADFKQLADTAFAVTGGRLGKIGNTFYLVGGQRFDGAYNPMGNPTYTQTYTNQVRKFTIDNSGTSLSVSNYTVLTDPVHLRRRDYNLVPQIFPNGDEGYTISSGVFQANVDLPFLYPVDITASGYTPVTGFNQYLSNYHSAYACLYDSSANEMHTLFFGGISQYYYQNATLVQDNQVPFVRTISRLTRSANGTLQEYRFPVEMPALQGAGAEFFPDHSLPHYPSDIIKLGSISQDTILIGHIYGGILSPALNPFSNNQASTTSASPAIYAVRLIRNTTIGMEAIDGINPYDISIFPNPVGNESQVAFILKKPVSVSYFVTNAAGQVIRQGRLEGVQAGSNYRAIQLGDVAGGQVLMLTFVFEDKYFVTRKVLTK